MQPDSQHLAAGTPARRPRRKWRKAAPQQRQAAAAVLAAAFQARGARGALWLLVLGSLLVHAVLLAPLGLTAASHAPLAGQQDAYLQKVIQKERARVVAASVARKITMPPPPPDPESVVRDALGGSLISDVTKLTGNLLDVRLQGELASYVRSSLKDELAAASSGRTWPMRTSSSRLPRRWRPPGTTPWPRPRSTRAPPPAARHPRSWLRPASVAATRSRPCGRR